MKYKEKDRVRIKSLDWYNENKDKYDCIYAGNGFCFWKSMSRHCGEIMKITIVKVDPEDSSKGYYFMENSEERWTDEMIEGLVEEEEEVGLIDVFSSRWINEFNLPDGYIFKDENGNVINATKIVLEKKKKEYPKTSDECYQITGLSKTSDIYGYKNGLLFEFQKLLIARDAYWKIAGEEMGLGKPWELSIGSPVYYIYYNRTLNHIKKDYADDIHGNIVHAFPTEEMRDVFYENFKNEIEKCKELL